MNNVPTVFDQILHKSLQPWLEINKPDEKFSTMINEIPIIKPEFQQVYEFDFYRYFNSKTQYYQKLIINESNSYCNSVISLISSDDNLQLTKYLLNDTLNKKLKTLIKDTGKLIKANDYSLLYINPKKSTFNEDADHKTDTYIIQLLKIALIKVYLEIQEVFKSYYPDAQMEIEDFYTQLLFEPIPEKTYLKLISKPIIIEEVSEKQPITNKPQVYNSFTYKLFSKNPDYINDLFDGLKSKGFIDNSSNKFDFKKIFSGKEISQPIIWTGTISDLHYFIKLIHNINQSVEDLKQHQWEVTCKCFVNADGSQFDRIKLKEQKKPKSTASILESIANKLK